MDEILLKAKNYGVITAGLVILSWVLQIAVGIYRPGDKWGLAVVTIFCMAAVAHTYLIMLDGITAIAQERQIETFIRSVLNFIRATILSVVALIFSTLLDVISSDGSLALVSILIAVVPLVYLGIVSLEIAKDFKQLEGQPAHRAALWHKIAGILMVSIVLIPLGILVSLLADYYMWRVISDRLNRSL